MLAGSCTVSRSFQLIEPLKDCRWEDFLQRHPRSSIFHTKAWLQVLHQTYGYEPVAFTTTPAGEDLENAVVFCVVQSSLVRPRLVSLPFSDHTDLLLDNQSDLSNLLTLLEQGQAEGKWKSVEFRPLDHGNRFVDWANFQDGTNYVIHRLDLRPCLHELFQRLHRDSIQRKIHRAVREGIKYEEGRSDSLLRQFYRLTMITRRRQALPPPPFAWFRNVVDCLGEQVKIRVASVGDRAVAAILTLFFKRTLIYKYGCSDAQFHNLGAMPFLMWRAMEDAKRHDLSELDLGRSDIDNAGLITFKNRFGATQSRVTYKKFPESKTAQGRHDWQLKVAKRVFAVMPERMLVMAGKLLYPHIG
jgi:CelD/BcsL family acetyltransferase involved in cellulose biosynthesis